MSKNSHSGTNPPRSVPATIPVGHANGAARPVGASPEAGSNGVPRVEELLRAFRKRWLRASLCGLVGAVLTFVVIYKIVPPPMYRAQSLVELQSTPRTLLLKTQETDVDFGTFLRSQLMILRSRAVIIAALDQLRESDAELVSIPEGIDEVTWLTQRIQTRVDGEILSIAIEGQQPEDLDELVNAVTQAYINEVVDEDRENRQRRYEELVDMRTTYRKDLALSRERLDMMARRLGSSEGTTIQKGQELRLEELTDARLRLRQIESELKQYQYELDYRKTLLGDQPAGQSDTALEAQVEVELLADKKLSDLDLQIQRLQYEIDNRKRLSSSEDTRKLKQDLTALQNRYAEMKEKLELSYRQTILNNRSNGLGNREEFLKQEIAVRTKIAEDLQAEIDALNEQSNSVNEVFIDFEGLKREIEFLEYVEEKVSREVETLKIEFLKAKELGMDQRVREIEAAGPARPAPDNRIRTAGMASIGVGGFLTLLVCWLEVRSGRVSSVEEFVHGLNIDLIGALPLIQGRKEILALQSYATTATGPGGSPPNGTPTGNATRIARVIEAVDAARAAILRDARINGTRTILITSALSGEGKTLLSTQLSVSLARSGRRCLVVDCDLRRSSLHTMMGIDDAPGLSEVLRGEVDLNDAMVQSQQQTQLWVLPAGQSDRSAIEALTSERVAEVLTQAREQFEFVICDAPPVLPVADALMLSQHTDATIYSIRVDVSRAARVAEADRRLRSFGANILGAVAMGSPNDLKSEYYYLRPNVVDVTSEAVS